MINDVYDDNIPPMNSQQPSLMPHSKINEEIEVMISSRRRLDEIWSELTIAGRNDDPYYALSKTFHLVRKRKRSQCTTQGIIMDDDGNNYYKRKEVVLEQSDVERIAEECRKRIQSGSTNDDVMSYIKDLSDVLLLRSDKDDCFSSQTCCMVDVFIPMNNVMSRDNTLDYNNNHIIEVDDCDINEVKQMWKKLVRVPVSFGAIDDDIQSVCEVLHPRTTASSINIQKMSTFDESLLTAKDIIAALDPSLNKTEAQKTAIFVLSLLSHLINRVNRFVEKVLSALLPSQDRIVFDLSLVHVSSIFGNSCWDDNQISGGSSLLYTFRLKLYPASNSNSADNSNFKCTEKFDLFLVESISFEKNNKESFYGDDNDSCKPSIFYFHDLKQSGLVFSFNNGNDRGSRIHSNSKGMTLSQFFSGTTRENSSSETGIRQSLFYMKDVRRESLQSVLLSKLRIPYILPIESIVSVDCSPFHTVALSSMGIVYSCGDGVDGQLGHGSTQTMDSFRCIEWFLSAKKKTGQHIHVTQISCGAHSCGSQSAAIDSDGNLYMWGKSILCGTVSSNNSSMSRSTALSLVTLEPTRLESLQRCRKVTCGGGYTIAISHSNDVFTTDLVTEDMAHLYSWGLIKNGRLGRLDKETNKNGELKQNRRFQIEPAIIEIMESEDVQDISAGNGHVLALTHNGEVFAWGENHHGQCALPPSLHDHVALPSLVLINGDVTPSIISINAGGNVSAFIDISGQLWLWGDFSPQSDTSIFLKSPENAHCYNSYSSLKTPKKHIPSTVLSCGVNRVKAVSLGHNYCGFTNDSGLSGIIRNNGAVYFSSQNKNAYNKIFCGGSKVFLSCGGNATSLLGEKLLADGNSLQGDSSLFDCVLIVSGRLLLCHKAVLSSRSRVFHEMLMLEVRRNDSELMTELLISDISYDIALICLEFIYTDNVKGLPSLPTILSDIMNAAAAYELWGLYYICHSIGSSFGYSGSHEFIDVADRLQLESLSRDFKSLLDNEYYSDVDIIVNGDKFIKSHRFILAASSEYFNELFQHLDKQEKLLSQRYVIKISLSVGSFREIFNFLYTGILQENLCYEDLLEGLRFGDAYKVRSLKILCEDKLPVKEDTVFKLLQVSEVHNSVHLKNRCKLFVTENLPKLVKQTQFIESLNDIHSKDSSLLRNFIEEILALNQRIGHRYDEYLDDLILSNGLAYAKDKQSDITYNLTREIFERAQLYKERKKQIQEENIRLLIGADDLKRVLFRSSAVLLIVFGFYLHFFQTLFPSGPIVPVVNVLVIAGFIRQSLL